MYLLSPTALSTEAGRPTHVLRYAVLRTVCLLFFFDKIGTNTCFFCRDTKDCICVILSHFHQFVSRILWKQNEKPPVGLKVIRAHLRTAKGKSCFQSYVHSVKSISVWRRFTFSLSVSLSLFCGTTQLLWHGPCFQCLFVPGTDGLEIKGIYLSQNFWFLISRHRHQDDHKCEKLEVQKPRMAATKELVQKIVGKL